MSLSKEDREHLISQLEKVAGSEMYFYLKFCGKKSYAEAVKAGKLYANTPEYFRQQELDSGIRGQGDKNELTLSLPANNIQVYDSETGNHVFSMKTSELRIKYNDDAQTPMVCFTGIPLHDMILVDADENHAEFDFPFTTEELAEMSNTFGPYCVIIGARELEEKIERMCNTNGIDYVFEQVEYVVPNSLEKMDAFRKGAKERFLFKDKDLSNQREYRLALDAEMPADHVIDIGTLDGAEVIETEMLKSLRIHVGYRSYRKED